MKLIFANRNYSSWSLRPWLVLKHFGIPFEEDQVLLSGEGWQEKIRKKSPSGKVPVLIDGEAIVPESIAIIEYLHDKFPAKGIWPSGPDRAGDGAFGVGGDAWRLLGAAEGGPDEHSRPASGQGRRSRRSPTTSDASKKSGAISLRIPAAPISSASSPRLTRCLPRSRPASGPTICPSRRSRRIMWRRSTSCRPSSGMAARPHSRSPGSSMTTRSTCVQCEGRRQVMHMIKLCVGVATLEELESYRSERAHWWGLDYGEDVHVHRTRTMPKRRAEIEGIGSIYWVISGVDPLPAAESCGWPRPPTRRVLPAAISSWRPTWCALRRDHANRSRAGAISTPKMRPRI